MLRAAVKLKPKPYHLQRFSLLSLASFSDRVSLRGAAGQFEHATHNYKNQSFMRPVSSYNTVSSLTLDDVSKFFHMPINEVSDKLGVCATVLKKICRRNGISRWPHRKIKSLDRVIASWEFLQPKTEEEAQKITEELKMLKAKRALLLRPPQRKNSRTILCEHRGCVEDVRSASLRLRSVRNNPCCSSDLPVRRC